jgi:hypothetical protein
MIYRKLAILCILLPVRLTGQFMPHDTIPLSESIPLDNYILKHAGDFTYETILDSVNTLVINELMASNSEYIFDGSGDDDDWFEIYNYGEDPVRLNTLYFTDDPAVPLKWRFDPPVEMVIEPGEHQVFWADEEPQEGFNHAAFRLSAEGEYLAIFAENGALVDQCYYGFQTTNISFGRFPDAGLTWNYFSDPTPGAPNSTSGSVTVLPVPTSNLQGGFYSGTVMLALFTKVSGGRIFYTTDCTEATTSGILYEAPVEINSNTIIRARVVKEGAIDSPELSISILMDQEDFENPVVSLIAEPEALFGTSGIISASISTVEVPAHMEYIEGGRTQYRGGTGIQLHAPRQAKPHSLRLLSRARYGNSWFDYPFFDEEGPDKFKRLILRNAGNDNVNKAVTNTHFRDPLIHTMGKLSNRRPMISESKPVNVYLNGNYHGLLSLREREDRYYIESHTGITENYDFIELEFGYYANLHIIEGSYDTFRQLLSFVDTTGNLALDSDYSLVKELVDLENFTDYWITEVFIGNYDWLSNNVKFWKSENGKWQWLYWDTDHGLGLVYSNYGKPEWNTLNWSLTFSDRAWANGYHNILIRNLLKNESYKAFFIKRFTQLLSTSFHPDNTLLLLDSMKTLYREDMSVHARQWGRSMTDWENAVQIVSDYLQLRPGLVLGHIQDFFGLQDPVALSLRVEPPGAGTISFSGLELSSDPVSGKFFPGMSYQLEYESIPGFELDQWRPFQSSETSIEFQLTDSMDIVAFFLPSDQSFPIQICEVYANNREAYDPGDWLELYYYGSDPINLEGWSLHGDQDQLLFTFDKNTVIQPGQRFLVTEDREQFTEIFMGPVLCYGNMIHGLSNHSTLVLRSASGAILKAIKLMSSPDWPRLPDEGFSLELKHIVDNSDLGSSWEISANSFGSPGLPNSERYEFSTPSGKDSIFSSHETHLLGFHTTRDFYSDPDHHSMAAISIKEVSGPGKMYFGDLAVEQGLTYMPSDLVFQPREPFNSPSSLTYSFTDISGQESSDHIIQFVPSVNITQRVRENFRLYPVPARDFCMIEIPPEHLPMEFLLFDLNGRMLQSIRLKNTDSFLNIDLTALESGMYFYLILTDQALVNGKIEVIK